MRGNRSRRALALLLGTALLGAACGDSDGTAGQAARAAGAPGAEADGSSPAEGSTATGEQPGISDDEIVIGHSNALSGPASAYGVITGTFQACFDWMNAEGGVTMADGKARKLRLVAYDDSYDPAKAVENVRRLIEEDQVFALVQFLGTPSNMAIYDYTNDLEVPNLFVGSGASKWGDGFVGDHPWTIGWQPAYSTEATIYASWLKENRPDAKVGILYQNDDFGMDYLEPFRQAIEGTGIEIVSEQSYEVADPTVDQQITELAASGADAFLNISTPKFAAQAIKKKAELGWDAVHLLSAVSAAVGSVFEPAGLDSAAGVISAHYFKDPTDPAWVDDPGMQQYREVVGQYGPDLDVNDTWSSTRGVSAWASGTCWRTPSPPARASSSPSATSTAWRSTRCCPASP